MKRSLVNSLHQVLALFCFRALFEQDMLSGGQYLPLVMAWFGQNRPDLNHAFDVYRRLRALQVIWPLVEPDSDTASDVQAMSRYFGLTNPQQIFDALLRETDKVVQRFKQVPDEIERLIDPENLRKELSNYEEHVLDPIHFMRRHEMKIRECRLYGKPSYADLDGLSEVLTASFLAAMRQGLGAALEQSNPSLRRQRGTGHNRRDSLPSLGDATNVVRSDAFVLPPAK
jgi:hypothetical protein